MSINRSRLFSNNLAHSVSDTVPQSSMTMLLRITSSYFQLCSSNWNNSYRTHLGSRNRQKTLQPQPFPTILATHSRSAQDCSYAGTSSLWPCALPVELSWDSAPEHSCSTKGQDLKQVLELGLVRSVTFSVPMGFHTASKGLSLPTNSQTAESSAVTAMKAEPEMPIPIISQTGTKPIEHTANDQRPKKDYLLSSEIWFWLLSSLKQLHLLSNFHIKAKCKEVDTTSFVCFILNYLFWFKSKIKEFIFAW